MPHSDRFAAPASKKLPERFSRKLAIARCSRAASLIWAGRWRVRRVPAGRVDDGVGEGVGGGEDERVAAVAGRQARHVGGARRGRSCRGGGAGRGVGHTWFRRMGWVGGDGEMEIVALGRRGEGRLFCNGRGGCVSTGPHVRGSGDGL